MRQLVEYHPVIGYRFIPGLKARVPHEAGGYLVRVNKQGFRCEHDFQAQKQFGMRRVLLFGDSYTAGDGVSNRVRYGDLLEKNIPNLEVYNFGLYGTGTDQQYLIYQEYGLGIDHDLMILSVNVENIRRVMAHYRYWIDENGDYVCHAKPYYELIDGRLVLRHVPPPKDPVPESQVPAEHRDYIDQLGRFTPLRKVVTKLGLKEVAQKLTRYQPVPHYENPKNPAWILLKAILEQWIHNHSRPVLLIPIPLHQYVEGTSDASHYQARFGELASETACFMHDPLPDLLAYPAVQRRGFRFKRDCHPSPAGHEALANSMAPVVTRILDAPRKKYHK